MNEITKLILTFIAGVVVGVLAATSTLFQGNPEPSPAEIATTSTPRESSSDIGQSPAEAPEPRAPVVQRAPEATPSEVEAETPQAQSSLVQAEPPESTVEEPEPEAGEDGETLAAVAQDAEERVFCMQMDNSGQCQCYDAETMAIADVSAEECREQLAEE